MENPRLRNEIDRLKIVSICTVNKRKRIQMDYQEQTLQTHRQQLTQDTEQQQTNADEHC